MTILAKDRVTILCDEVVLTYDLPIVSKAMQIIFMNAKYAFQADPTASLRLEWSVITKDHKE